MFYSRWFGVISLDFSSIVYRSVDFIPCIDTLAGKEPGLFRRLLRVSTKVDKRSEAEHSI